MKHLLFSVCGCAVIISFLAGCRNNGKNDDKGVQSTVPKADSNSTLLKINNQIFSIPSPIQTAMLVRKSGYEYNKQMLNASENYSKYDTRYKKALNLGIYGADLGYISLYDQTQDALVYLSSLEKLATDLHIADVFTPALVKRFNQNMGKQDSLLAMVSEAFGKSDAYFKNNKENDISSLVLVGGWIESLYFAIQASNSPQADKKEIIRRIAEQKISLQNMVKMLQPYSSQSPEYADLIKQLSSLSDIFDNVEFVYNYVPPTVDAKNKMTIINSTSDVKIENNILKEISDKITAMRNQIAG